MSEYAAILAFDVKIDSDARKHADETNVRIFTADIIYHLFDQFTAHMDRFMEQKRQDARDVAVFPCIAKVLWASTRELCMTKSHTVIFKRKGLPCCAALDDGYCILCTLERLLFADVYSLHE